MNTPDWNDIHYFITLVEKQTLTAAAETLNVGHSTVSRRIARLETIFGLRLFDRIGKRYLPSEHGRRIYLQACELSKNMAVLQRVVREQGEAAAEVVVTAPPAVICGLLPLHLPAFYTAHPHIRLVLQSSTQLFDLHRRQADIALRFSYPARNDLAVRRLRTIRFGFYACRSYLENLPRRQWQFVMLSTDNTVSRWAEQQIGDATVVLTCNDFLIIKQAVASGLGVGLLPDCYVDNRDGFTAVTPDKAANPAILEESLLMVMHEDVRRSPAVRAVADFWAQTLGRETGGLAKQIV